MINKFVILIISVFAIGCATPGPATYGPVDANGFGFSETPIEADRYRILFRGSAGMSPETVEDFAFRRAAELTKEKGYDWFRVVSRSTAGDVRGGVDVGGGVGTGSVGRRSSVGVGIGGNFGRLGAREFYTTRLEVLMANGETPDEADAYNASIILDIAREQDAAI